MGSIKAVIFDLDGVLVDTAKYHFKAWQALARKLNIHFTEEENEQLKGVSRKESLERILEWGNKSLSEAEKVDYMNWKNEEYLRYVDRMNEEELLEGVGDFLTKCRELKLKIALGSASKNARLILNKTGITHFFDSIVDGNSTTLSKPDPQVFLMGATELDVTPQEAIVFEDSLAGVQAARNGNFKAVGIGQPQILAKADKVVDGLHQINIEQLINEL